MPNMAGARVPQKSAMAPTRLRCTAVTALAAMHMTWVTKAGRTL